MKKISKKVIEKENQEVNFLPIKIGVFNSSSNLAYNYQHRVKNTIKIFKENNYEIELGKLSFKKGNYRSGSIKERSDEFNHLLKNTNVLMSMIGGFNSSSILNEIDYEYIKKNNIKIVGCSDTTSILLAIYKNTNIPVYYGPSFLMSYDEQDYIKQFNLDIFFQKVIQDFPGVLKYPNKITIQKHDWKNTKIINKKLIKNRIKILNVTNDIIEGRLLGGNLNTMASLIGTKFMPEFKKGDILFIEDSHVNAQITERNMSVLKNTGILDKISCVIIGLIENYDDLKSKRKYHEILLEFMENNVPIIYDFPCSHIQPSTILKIGAILNINLKTKTFTFKN